MEAAAKPSILCVDDEQMVLDGLARTLRQHFAVTTALGGEAGLVTLAERGPFAVVVSDMRMPGMNGATFLRHVRERAAESTRILLTGQTELDAAIAAVNEGNIFRFLSKPCPPETLVPAIQAAAEQHRLMTAERVLLEQTLRGCVKALTEILALASPAAFGRANRVKQHVSRLVAVRPPEGDPWQIEVAAMLSQIGCVTLLPQTSEKLYHGQELSPAEQGMVDRLPETAAQLLANIPRLEPVRDALAYQAKRFDGSGTPADRVRGEQIPWGARVLKIVLDYDALETQGLSVELALDSLRGRNGWYDPALLQAFAEMLGHAEREVRVQQMRLSEVRAGMVFAEDVTSNKGVLLIARGQEVTPGLLNRIRNFSAGIGVKEPIRMVVGGKPAADADARAAAAR